MNWITRKLLGVTKSDDINKQVDAVFAQADQVYDRVRQHTDAMTTILSFAGAEIKAAQAARARLGSLGAQ